MTNPNIPGSEEAQWVLNFVTGILILVIAIVLAGIVLYFSFSLFGYFQHPDDNDKTAWSKFVVISSIWLVIYIPIFSALDFASVYTGCPAEQGGLGQDIRDFTNGTCMAPMKTIMYSLMAAAIFWNYWLIPFTLVLRENQLSASYGSRFTRAFLTATLQGGIIIGIACLLWKFTGHIAITTHLLVSGWEPYNATDLEARDVCINGVTGWVSDEFDDLVKSATTPVCRAPERASFVSDLVTGYDNPNQAMTVTDIGLFNYIQCIHVVMGWFVLSVLGGVGLAAMPWKLINDFIHRERVPMTRSEYIRKCQALRKRAMELKEAVEKAKDDPEISEREKTLLKQKMIRSLVLMEKEDEHMTRVFPDGADPELAWTKTVISQWVGLAYGIVGLVISCLWIAQITSYGIADPPFYLGLNRIFALKDGQIFLNIFSLVLLVIFSLHLNVCCNQGLFSFCMFFPFLAVHPLTAGTTMIDQFLCQSQVGLYSAPALLAFQVSTLPLAAARSNTAVFFGFQFQYLEIWGFLFQSGFYMYLMLTCFGLTVLVGGMKEIRRIFKVWVKKRELAAKALTEDY